MEKLKLSDIRPNLTFRIGKSLNIRWIDFANGRYDGVLDFDVFLPTKGMNLQRELCWTLEQKQQFMLSVLKEMPIPPICTITYRQGDGYKTTKLQIIDGKQRINAYIDFIHGKYPLPTGHYYNDLEDECKQVIGFLDTKYDDASIIWEDISDDQKIAWFESINFTGTPQDAAHLNRLKA